MEYYLAIKWNIILIYATTWMNLENIMNSGDIKPVTEGHILYDSTYMRYLE